MGARWITLAGPIIGLSLALISAPADAQDPQTQVRIERLARIVAKDSSFKIRALAARRLGGLARSGDTTNTIAIGALTRCTRDDNEVVRGVCVKALGDAKASSALTLLDRIALTDRSRAVRDAASASADRIRANQPRPRLVATKRTRRLTVALGRVELDQDPSVEATLQDELLRVIRSAIEDRIEPHRPAVMPRESPDLRIDVIVQRVSSDPAAREIRFEARVVIIELPGANLRHASQAIATTRGSRRKGKKRVELEERIALQAVNRAVDEALVTLLGSS